MSGLFCYGRQNEAFHPCENYGRSNQQLWHHKHQLQNEKTWCWTHYSPRADIQGSLRRRKCNGFHSCVASNILILSTSVNANLLPISTKVVWFGLVWFANNSPISHDTIKEQRVITCLLITGQKSP